MDIRVSGHQLDVGAALTRHIEQRLGTLAEKYDVGITGATATLAPGPHEHEFRCDILMQLSQGIVLKAEGRAHDEAHMAFDVAAEKLEKQLRRYKRKLTDREKRGHRFGALTQADYRVLQADTREEVDEAGDNALVIAETRSDIPEASVSDAVMLLDLRHTPALLFKNSQTGSFNMVYRREDGHVGWVEPQA